MKKYLLVNLILFLVQIGYSQPNANTWTWQSGDNIPNETGLYGPSSISPGNRPVGGRWVFNGKLYIFSGSGYGYNDMWEYDHATSNWTWIKGTNNSTLPTYGIKNFENANNTPGGRSNCLSWVRNNKFYMFGGYGYDKNGDLGYLNDLWVYDPTTNNWKWISGADTINQPTSTLFFNTIPGARANAVSALLAGKLIVFGGYGIDLNSAFGNLNDLWEYDVQSNIWTHKLGQLTINDPGIYNGNFSDYPASRANAAFWERNDELFLMGGNSLIGGSYQSMNDLWKYEYFNNQFTILKGSNIPNEAPVFGQKNIPDQNNTPGSLAGGTCYTIGNSLFYFGGIDNANQPFNALWQYNVSTNQWAWIKGENTCCATPVFGTKGVEAIQNTPVIYTEGGPPLSWLYQNKLYVYENANQQINHWQLNTFTNNWTWIKTTIQQPIYGNIGLNNNNLEKPGGRYGACTWEHNGKMYMFGGQGNGIFQYGQSTPVMNDLWEYEPITKQWHFISGSFMPKPYGEYGTINIASVSNYPGGRFGAQVAKIGNKVYLFGGYGVDSNVDFTSGPHLGYLNDLWEYDLTTKLWTWLKGSAIVDNSGIYGTKGIANPLNTPGGRYDHVLQALNSKIYLLGGTGIDGIGNSNPLNDVWEYDPQTNNWRWLKGDNLVANIGNYGTINSPNITNEIPATQGSNSWVVNNKLYVFGGYKSIANYSSFLSGDLWEYNPATNIWTWIKGPNDYVSHAGVYGTLGLAATNSNPGSRNLGFSFSSENKLYLFGGNGLDSSPSTISQNLNDLWEFNLTTKNWKWLKGPNIGGQDGVFGTKGIASANNNPSATFYGAGTVVNNKFTLFGGLNTLGESNDIWEYIPTITCTSMSTIASGNWNNTDTWSCGRLPIATDNIVIKAGHKIIVPSNFQTTIKQISTEYGAVLSIPSSAVFTSKPN
jgi:N-acetylneuraminic acid mutarotase